MGQNRLLDPDLSERNYPGPTFFVVLDLGELDGSRVCTYLLLPLHVLSRAWYRTAVWVV